MFNALQSATVLLQSSGGGGGAGSAIVLIFYLAFFVAVIAGLWKTFEKAGQPGWGAIIPIYNYYLMIKVAKRPDWWIILYFIPLVSLIPAIIVPIDIAKNFGKGAGYGLGLAFLPFIFFPLLGFSDAQYQAEGVGREAAAQHA